MARLAPYTHGHPVWTSRKGCICPECEDTRERGRMRKPSLPAEPLRAYLPQATWVHDGHTTRVGGLGTVLTPTKQRMLFRALRAGAITPRAADEIAVALHMHPIEIWGDAWLQ